jgi:hypothetical protein
MVPASQPSQHAVQDPHSRAFSEAAGAAWDTIAITPQHFLYFFPLPQVQGSFLPGFTFDSEGKKR